MSITQVHMGAGSWAIGLRFPGVTWDLLNEFGHVVVTSNSFSPSGKTDSQYLAASIYTGVVTERVRTDGAWRIGGSGMDFWLGDGVTFGEVLEPPKLLNTNYFEGASFTAVVNALMPQALTVGTIYASGLTAGYYNEHVWDTPINALRYLMEAFAAIHGVDVEYRVNQDGTIDLGLKTSIYVTSPTAVITRRKTNSPGHTSHGGKKFTERVDASGYATRAVLQAQGAGYTLKIGAADLVDIGKSNPYKDIKGNVLKRVKVLSEPETPQYTSNPNYLPDFRAELHLSDTQELGSRVTVRGNEWDISDIGSFDVGDFIWVYNNEDSEWKDTGNPVSYDGGTIYPVKKRVFKKTFPVHTGAHKVFYRDKNASYTELTSLLVNENVGSTGIEVGSASRKLAYNPDLLRAVLLGRAVHNPDTNNDPQGEVDANGDPTIPGQVLWSGSPWGYNTWVDETGKVKIEILVQWAEPTNTNGDPITDGDRYELEIKRSTDANWRPGAIVGWGNTSRLISGLESTPTTGWTWDFRIRAVDNSGNAGLWSATESVAAADTTPPSQPAAPTVTALPLYFEFSHTGLKNAGGNLEGDTKYLRFHVSTSDGFTPSDANLVGRQSLRAGNKTVFYGDVSSYGNGTALHVVVVAEDWVGNLSVKSPQISGVVKVITTTEITDNAVTTPKLIANSVTAGKLASVVMEVGKYIQSTGFVAGGAGTGFRVDGNGNAEFNSVTVRGTIYATAGEIGGLEVVGGLELKKQGSSITVGDVTIVGAPYLKMTANQFGDGDVAWGIKLPSYSNANYKLATIGIDYTPTVGAGPNEPVVMGMTLVGPHWPAEFAANTVREGIFARFKGGTDVTPRLEFGKVNTGTTSPWDGLTTSKIHSDKWYMPSGGIFFYNDQDTGIAWDTANSMKFIAANVERMQLGNTNLNFGAAATGRPMIRHAAGSALLPSYTYAGSTNGYGNKGYYSDGANVISASFGGSRRMSQSKTGLSVGGNSIPGSIVDAFTVIASSTQVAGRFYRATAATNNQVIQVRSNVGGTEVLKWHVDTDGDAIKASDPKFKNRIRDARSYWEDMKKVNLITFAPNKAKNSPRQIGYDANNIAEIWPKLAREITYDRDGLDDMTQRMVNISAIDIIKTSVLQEAMLRIEELEGRLRVLEKVA